MHKGLFGKIRGSLRVLGAGLILTGGASAFAEQEMLPLHPGSLGYAGIYTLREADPQLSGAGVRIASICRSLTYANNAPEFDYLINLEHNCMRNRRIEYVDGMELGNGISDHATAVAAILTGFDPIATHPLLGDFVYEGAAPEAELDVYEFWNFIRSYVFEGNEFEADVATLSVGSVFESWWTRGIDKLAESKGVTVVASIGNGSSVYDPPLYPAMGSNVIGVGVIDSVNSEKLIDQLYGFYLPRAEHSSFGPGADGRCGPDLVAPGNCLVPSATSEYDYETTGNWSSFAAPVVAGAVALLKQRAKAEPNLAAAAEGSASNCVMKSILLNSAKKLPYWHKGAVGSEDDHAVPLDHLQGAGAVNAAGAMEQLEAGRHEPGFAGTKGWDVRKIGPMLDTSVIYEIETEPETGKYIAATVCWNRHYANKYPFEALRERDSDLRLEVWAIDAADPSRDLLVDYSDSAVDNIEHVYFAPVEGYSRYLLVVSHGDGADGRERTGETFAIAWDFEAEPFGVTDEWFDLDGDGQAGQSDLVMGMAMAAKISEQTAIEAYGDINLDGRIDIQDVSKLLAHIRESK